MNRWSCYATKFKGIALNCFSSFNLIGANCIRSNRLVLSSIFTKVSKPLTYHFFKQLFQTAWFRSFNFPSRKISRQRGTMARHIRGDPVIQFCTEAKLLEGLAFASWATLLPLGGFVQGGANPTRKSCENKQGGPKTRCKWSYNSPL